MVPNYSFRMHRLIVTISLSLKHYELSFVAHVLDSLTSALVIPTIDIHFRLPGTEPRQNARETLSFICVVQLFSLHGKQSEIGTKQAQALISIPFSVRGSEW